jgi:hypothetical protein
MTVSPDDEVATSTGILLIRVPRAPVVSANADDIMVVSDPSVHDGRYLVQDNRASHTSHYRATLGILEDLRRPRLGGGQSFGNGSTG